MRDKKEKKKSMTVTYEVDGGLYINVTNRCTNSCDFCIRNNADGAYGSESLWLLREPSVEEILEAVLGRDLPSYKEVVFCGYGEPTIRLDVIGAVARGIKEKYPKTRIRVNTNGHSDLIFGRDTAPDFEGCFDTVSISLNAPTNEKYCAVCHSAFGDKTLDGIIKFASNVKNYVQKTRFTVVKESLTEKELEECQRIADACGVELYARTYISSDEGNP